MCKIITVTLMGDLILFPSLLNHRYLRMKKIMNLCKNVEFSKIRNAHDKIQIFLIDTSTRTSIDAWIVVTPSMRRYTQIS